MPFEIVKPGTHIDFIGKWRIAAAVSISLILAGLVGTQVLGFRLGIDFAGGNEVQIRFADDARVDEGRIRGVMQELGLDGSSVVRYGAAGSNEFLVKFKGERVITEQLAPETAAEPPAVSASPEEAEPVAEAADGDDVPGEEAPGAGATPEQVADVLDRLEAALQAEIGPLTTERVEFVGPKVGAELRSAGIQSLVIAALLILAYIWFRFSIRFAPGAVVALVHDVLITSGLWVLLGLEFDLRVLAALLAIVGYSLNDTIIVYDRIRENMEIRTTHNLIDVLNQSVNQTLSRTLLTSATTLLAVLSLLFLGGEAIRPFALAMTIGIVVGTYSSVYVAAPTVLFLETRFGTPA